MPFQDFLYLLAELAAAFVGFSAIGLMLGARRGTVWNFAISGLIERGLAAGFFAILPTLVASFGVDHSLVWKLCSIGIAIYLCAIFFRSARNWTDWDESTRPLTQSAYAVRAGLSLVVMLLALVNGYFGWIGIYLLSVVWVLIAAAWTLLMLLADLRAHDTNMGDSNDA